MSCMMVLEKTVYHHSVILTGEWQLGRMSSTGAEGS